MTASLSSLAKTTTSRIHQMFEQRVKEAPEDIAVVYEDQQLTYKELNERSNQLAHYLRKKGVGPDILVGIYIERSLEMVIGLLGILKAGGAYVPIDSTYPKERVAFMLEDCGTPLLITQKNLINELPSNGVQVVSLDSDWKRMSKEKAVNPKVNIAPKNLAYVIYTSGSTGKPKGAMNTHQGIFNRLLWMQDEYQINRTDCILQKTPFSFDVSVWEFFWPLMTGSRLVVAKPERHQDPDYLISLIKKQNITTLHFVPPMMQAFLEAEEVEDCSSIRRIICSGESLPLDLQAKFFSKFKTAELHNLYGPTEAGVDVTSWACQRESDLDLIPIGKPIANTQIYILDKNLKPVPVGVAGELHIGGIQLARGYHNRPELTGEKFIRNPFDDDPKSRLYKTGDLTRFLPDGNIEYLGRIDNQVKIRGFRIELGEVETVLSEHESIRDVVVLARSANSLQAGAGQGKRLVAYIRTVLHKQPLEY